MSWLGRLFGSPDTAEIIKNSRGEEWRYDSTPCNTTSFVPADSTPYRTCLVVGISNDVPPCKIEAERDRLKAQVEELMASVHLCHDFADKHKSKRNTGRNRNGAEACTHIAAITDFVIHKYTVDEEDDK